MPNGLLAIADPQRDIASATQISWAVVVAFSMHKIWHGLFTLVLQLTEPSPIKSHEWLEGIKKTLITNLIP